MPTVNEKSLRAELQSAKEQIEVLRKLGKVPPETDAVCKALLTMLTLLLAVLLRVELHALTKTS